MAKQTRPKYSPEFRLEVAQQVVDEQRSIRDVAEAMGLGKSTVDKWARQLRQERQGNLSSATPLTPDQLKIRELERKLGIKWDRNQMGQAQIICINRAV
ncbi:transposase [Pseudoalteromonas luteoviolacea]|uniref:Transposase n=1 Tax=Pseudoalteromonas luteoviolacea S4054 TaxID=1129367 RepID=A0A0F6A443_9GAMM|nr:transposase [Pseudoalteromonas luteoviolacea]AOT11097.1 transposase [Pseudoalteromonas luteoviolacea]AOT15739.1 transposase [Pseudoalteromonas luteoviolacea]AOT20918.1 transposase [Pseudoalteromonas luteoviolacea]KKE80965.1 hypothetical protein N479_23955 [Pseudoalteromonas luteoviolacea S4054]KZN74574.1 hypothetical protein N481_09120 [Pseudoalteromonas luteoviolacea S4047-1]